MANINELLARAAALRDETALNSISPERAGGIMYDTLVAMNELWLQQGAALVISKIYASVAAMEADTAPVSDLTGKPLRPGMIVVVASSDSDNGSVYRYNGTAAPRWSMVGSIGDVSPVDSLDSDSAQLPLAARQGKVLDGKISQLGQYVDDNTLKEYARELEDENIAGYLTDKNNLIIAKLMKSGAVEWLVDNAKTIQTDARIQSIEELLAYVSSELPETETNIIKYLTDRNGAIIATINKTGGISFDGGGGFDGEITKSRNIRFDAIKVLTDNKGTIIGWIGSDGKVHVEELEAKRATIGKIGNVLPFPFWEIIGMISEGRIPRYSVNDKTYKLLETLKGEYKSEGVAIEANPCITLYDDDAIDSQLPTSYAPTATADTPPSSYYSNKGGYASVLFPLIHAFNKKYGTSITCFSAAEGQRIGLTKLFGYGDDFDGNLNNNGRVLKHLIETGEWEVVCHSMTARYTAESYIVDGIDSTFANEVLQNGVWDGDLSWNTTTCYNTVDGKNYQIKEDKSGWTEIPVHYAKPYCAVSLDANSQLVINPTYSCKYQVDEWFKRASRASLPYSMQDVGKRIYANWGSSHSIWHIKQNLKYADYGFGGTAETNTIPLDSVVHRFSWEARASINQGESYSDYSGNFNVYTEKEYQRLVDMIDTCAQKGGWSLIGSHANTAPCWNYYFDALVNYIPTGETEPVNLYDNERVGDRLNYYDSSYPAEWAVPLKYEELQDIIGDNIHDYLNNPPSRLGIASWADWYPCPGTGLALLWDVLKYAISKGITFISAEEGFQKFGNLFTLGYLFTNGEVFAEDRRLGDIPEENQSHCIIGANGSVNYTSN